MKPLVRSLWQSWDKFWFAPIDLLPLSLFRCVLMALLFLMYLIRFLDVELFYFNSGLMPADLASTFLPDLYRPLVYWFPSSDTAVWWLHLLFLGLLLTQALGWGGRKLTWMVLLVHLGFMQRNYTIIYGADLISTFWLLYVALAENNRRVRWGRKAATDSMSKDPLTPMAWRLIQVQLCITYAFTGWEKLKGASWWEGSAVWHVVGNSQIAPMDLSFLSNWPLLIVAMTWLTLLFEVYFCVMVWIKPVRYQWLAIGVAFHLGAAILMGLHFFSLLMICAYIVFLRPRDLRRWSTWLLKRVKLLGALSPAGATNAR